MTASRDRVRSDDATVRELVGAMIDLVESSGGAVHPGLWVNDDGGSLSVHVDGGAGDVLIEVPSEILVPVDRAGIEVIDGRLTIVSPDDEMTAAQREGLDAHIGLYNATDKVTWALRSLPGVALAGDASALEVIGRFRFGDLTAETSTARGILATRVLSHRRASSEPRSDIAAPSARVETLSRPVLMPLLDLVNHHHLAPGFRSGRHVVGAKVAHPAGGTETFVSYGPGRSVVDLALRYGFVASASRTTRFCPVEVDVDGLCIRVEGRSVRAQSAFDPPAVGIDGSTLTLSHLSVDADHPRRLEAALSLALQMACRQQQRSEQPGLSARIVLAEIVRADRAVVTSILEDLSDRSPVLELIVGAVDLHCELVDEVSRVLGIDV